MDLITVYVLPVLAWAYLELGDIEQAASLIAEAVRRARAKAYRLGLVQTALRVQALVAIEQKDWGTAEAALREGLALAREAHYPEAEGRLLHVFGLLYARRGEPGPAREQLEAALAIFRRLGARKAIEQTERLLATHLHQHER